MTTTKAPRNNKRDQYVAKLQRELDECGLIALFEIEVNDKDCVTDYVVCEISFRGHSLIAQREAVSTKERRSKFIATSKIPVDFSLGLDCHLQELHEAILEDIASGDLFTMN